MLKDFLRTMGGSLILSGTLLFFLNNDENLDKADRIDPELQSELVNLEKKLVDTQRELTILQSTILEKEKNVEEVNSEAKSELDAKPLTKIIFEIQPGANPVSVSHSLYKLGIITNNAEIEQYLEANALSGKVQVGEYILDSSMSIETIAKTITKTN